MAARFGSKTRVTEPVAGFGQRATAGGGTVLQPYEQIFTSPGTWTCPPTVTYVDVLLVGGGGGGGGADYTQPPVGGGQPGEGQYGGAGGGGGVRVVRSVPVSAPVPVTVGAGGTGGPATTPSAGSVGGTSSFGPESVGGGGGGGGASPTTVPNIPTYSPLIPFGGIVYGAGMDGVNAPPTGGGGGGGGMAGYKFPGFPSPNNIWYQARGGTGGSYGQDGGWSVYNGTVGAGGGSRTSSYQDRDTFGSNASHLRSGGGYLGYGVGGIGRNAPGSNTATANAFGGKFYGPNSITPPGVAGSNGTANTGMGGEGAAKISPGPAGFAGGTGGSGIVIVRWVQ